jgi:hypothetical protein
MRLIIYSMQVDDPTQRVTIVNENGDPVTFGETVEVPVSDAGVVLSEVGGEMVMQDASGVQVIVFGYKLDHVNYLNIPAVGASRGSRVGRGPTTEPHHSAHGY